MIDSEGDNPFDTRQETTRFTQTTIFDLDHTLCNVNTSFRFGIYLTYKRFLPLHKMSYLMGWYLLHKMGVLSIAGLHYKACSHLFHGKSINVLSQHVQKFLDTNLPMMLNQEMFKRLKKAKSKGDYTVLLSSSPDFLVGEIAERMQFHDWAGTEYALLENKKIGEVGQLMEGENKAQYVRQLMKKMNIKKEKITAYSDSYLDLPFLEAVGNPIAVNPDKTLRKESIKRNWTII